MDHLDTVEDVFSNRMFRIPDYQRGYAWQKEQWDDLLQDLELLLEGKEHFTGTLVLLTSQDTRQQEDEEGRTYSVYDVVDGQQRLTTIVLLLDAIRREMKRFESLEILASGLRKTYITVNDRNRQPMPKLTLNRDCHRFFYNTVLVEQSPDVEGPQIRSHQLLADAKTYFAEYLKEKREELGPTYPEWLESLRTKITRQLAMIVYEVGDEADAGVIFETMNDRGMRITELEKVKNYLLYLSSKLDLEVEHTLARDVNDTWTHIFEHLMAAELGHIENEDQLLRAHWLMAYDYQSKKWKGSRSIKDRFSLRRYQGRHPELLQHLQEYINTLRNAATAYCDVFTPTHPSAFNDFKSDEELYKQLGKTSEKLARLGSVAPFLPLLIAVRLKFPDNGRAYLETVSLCEKFAFRVYRWQGSRADTGRARLYRLGHDLFRGHKLQSVLNGLRRTLLHYCSDQQFRDGFGLGDENNWYNWSGLKYFLYEYEEHLAQAQGLEVRMPWSLLADKKDTIEHILPQHPEQVDYWIERFSPDAQRKYTHDIGNLCLTYDNRELGNKPFPKKKGEPGAQIGYVNSIVFMEKQLARYDDWTETELLARRKEIEGWALKRWHVEPPPPSPEPAGKLEAIQVLADQHGVTEEFQAILETARKHDLYPRPRKWCIWYAPPSNHTRALFTVWPKPGQLLVGVWLESFPEFFDVTNEQTKAILGVKKWRTVTASNVQEFTANLDRLFEEIEKAR